MIFIVQACQWQDQMSSNEFKILPNKDQMCNDVRVPRHFNNPSDISFIVYTMKYLILDLIRSEDHKFIHLICDVIFSTPLNQRPEIPVLYLIVFRVL